MILLLLNISRKRWDDAFVNLGEIIPEFATMENTLNNYLGFISKYGSGSFQMLGNLFNMNGWNTMQNMFTGFNTDMFFKKNPFLESIPSLDAAVTNFSNIMPTQMKNKYLKCCDHFNGDKRYNKCINTPNFKPAGIGPKIKKYRQCKKDIDSGLNQNQISDSNIDSDIDSNSDTDSVIDSNIGSVIDSNIGSIIDSNINVKQQKKEERQQMREDKNNNSKKSRKQQMREDKKYNNSKKK